MLISLGRTRPLIPVWSGRRVPPGPPSIQWLIHNEPIWKDGETVGHVTSGDFGCRINKMVGLASVRRKEGVSKAWIDEGGFQVQIAGTMFKIKAQLAPFYDAKGDLMRS